LIRKAALHAIRDKRQNGRRLIVLGLLMASIMV
jgi:hypothetical protein